MALDALDKGAIVVSSDQITAAVCAP